MKSCTFVLPFVLTLSSCDLGNLGLRPFSGDLVGLPPGFLGLPAFLGLPNSFSSIVCGVVPPDVLRDEFAVLDYNQTIIFSFSLKISRCENQYNVRISKQNYLRSGTDNEVRRKDSISNKCV